MKRNIYTYAMVFCCALCLQLNTVLTPCCGEEGAPDLVISGYGKFVEDNPWLRLRDVVAPGDTVVYSITITNQGDTAYEGPIHVEAFDLPNGWQTEAATAPVILPPYSQEQTSYSIKVPIVIPDNVDPGKYNTRLRIDTVQGEKRTYNNLHKVPVNILPPQPDLSIVDIRWKPLEFPIFDRPDIEVIMRNQGTADAGASKLVLELQIGSERYTTHLEAEIPGIKQGDTQTWKFENILGTGMFSPWHNRNVVKATINADRRLVEHNYHNNERVKYLAVREGPLYTDLDWQPHDPTTQDEIDFTFTVTNEGDARWIFPDYRRDGRGATIILRYWPAGDFDAAKVIEDSLWVLGAGKSHTVHFRERIQKPGEYRVKCEIFAGFPYWTVTQTPEMVFNVTAP